MRTIIALCAVIALIFTGCVDYTPMGTTYVTISNKSSCNLRMEEYDQDYEDASLWHKKAENIIKKNESISYEISDTFGAPTPQRGNVTVFYNTDDNKHMKTFEKLSVGKSKLFDRYKLTKERGEYDSFSNPEKKWYLLEITDEILR